ncbi:uncharacterized protein LOC115254731 [Aedes albopictus]|uniref:Secreted protein n=1 Tax=Aedes albopictus TaxID=7160 RepID=A0ABM1Y6N5_AEDAL
MRFFYCNAELLFLLTFVLFYVLPGSMMQYNSKIALHFSSNHSFRFFRSNFPRGPRLRRRLRLLYYMDLDRPHCLEILRVCSRQAKSQSGRRPVKKKIQVIDDFNIFSVSKKNFIPLTTTITEAEHCKMLPQILKAIRESNQEAITTETLLGQLRQGLCKPEPQLQSQFNLALAEGQRTGLVSVQSGHVKPLIQLDQFQEPRSFSCQLLLVGGDLQPTAGSSRVVPTDDADAEVDDDDTRVEDCDCDCHDRAATSRPAQRSSSSSGGSRRWLRPRNTKITYDELKLIRQVFSRSELGPEWNESRRRVSLPPGATSQVASGTRGRTRRRSTAEVDGNRTRSGSRRRRPSTARVQTRSRSRRGQDSRSRSRTRV